MRKLLLASVASVGLAAAAGVANAQPAMAPAPGTTVVHLNGYFMYNLVDYGSTGMTSEATGGTKRSPLATSGDFRLYPGFDAQTPTGLQYGATVELRTTLNATPGKGVNNGFANPTTTGVDAIYVRRAYGYAGNAESGFVRFGQTDSVFGLMQAGVLEGFGDYNQYNADGGVENAITSGTPAQFIYADTGNLYTTDKIVYFTPAIVDPMLGGKLSAGVGYEPNSNGLKESTGTDENDSAISGSSATRRQNTVDAMAAYAVSINGFASKLSAGYLVGSPLGNSGANSAYPATAPHGYDELSVFQVGAQTTTMGITVGANVKAGSVEDSYSLKPKGARDGLDYIVGATYVMGPVTVGSSFFDAQSSGAWDPTNHDARSLSEYGVAVGADYQVAKPMAVYVQYLYGHKHQPTSATAPGNSQDQAIGLGALLKW